MSKGIILFRDNSTELRAVKGIRGTWEREGRGAVHGPHGGPFHISFNPILHHVFALFLLKLSFLHHLLKICVQKRFCSVFCITEVRNGRPKFRIGYTFRADFGKNGIGLFSGRITKKSLPLTPHEFWKRC
jgi:hypothetical protein